MTTPTTTQIFFNIEHWKHPFFIHSPSAPHGQIHLGDQQKSVVSMVTAVVCTIFAFIGTAIIVKAGIITAGVLPAAIIVAAALIAGLGVLIFYGISAVLKAAELRQQAGEVTQANAEEAGAGSGVPEIPVNPDVQRPSAAPISGVASSAPLMMMGLPNIGSSCWLNSAVKFFATSRAYDAALNEPVILGVHANTSEIVSQLRLLQVRLQAAITTVRRGVSLTAEACRLLRLAIKPFLLNCDRSPQDAFEFLTMLFSKFPSRAGVAECIAVGLPGLIADPFVDVLPALMARDEPLQSVSDTLLLFVERGRNGKPILLDRDATLTLPIAVPEGEWPEWHKYRLDASLKNIKGHWVFYEINAEGQVVLHDDEIVVAKSIDEMKTSHLFRFQHVGVADMPLLA